MLPAHRAGSEHNLGRALAGVAIERVLDHGLLAGAQPVRQLYRAMVAIGGPLRNDNLTLPQLAALHLIAARGRMRIGALATELLLPMPAASRMVSDMVQRGLLLREEDETDRRARTVRVAPAATTSSN